MNCLIVEDEKVAAERLVGLIKKFDPSIDITEIVQSVKNAVQWLNTHQAPDLIFMDIQLADGLSFEIFEQTIVKAPVIFTTAYNEYALRAFKVNSIDYLLKPIDKTELQASISKYQKLKTPLASNPFLQPQLIKQVMEMIKSPYKTRIVVRVGEHIKAIGIEDAAYFYT